MRIHRSLLAYTAILAIVFLPFQLVRAAEQAITRKLENIIDRLYQRGVQYYGAGGALGFDYEKGNIM